MVAGWTSNVASCHAGAKRAASPIVKRCHGAQRTRPAILRCATIKLLPEQCVLSHETGVIAHDVGG